MIIQRGTRSDASLFLVSLLVLFVYLLIMLPCRNPRCTATLPLFKEGVPVGGGSFVIPNLM